MTTPSEIRETWEAIQDGMDKLESQLDDLDPGDADAIETVASAKAKLRGLQYQAHSLETEIGEICG